MIEYWIDKRVGMQVLTRLVVLRNTSLWKKVEKNYACSPRMRRARARSFTIRVTRLPWMAHAFASSKSPASGTKVNCSELSKYTRIGPTRYASLAS